MDHSEVTLNNISEYVSFLIYEFCKKNTDPFFEAFDKNVVWIGVSDGQFIHTAEEIKKHFQSKSPLNEFSVGPIYTEVISNGKKCCTTISFFRFTSVHPDGDKSIYDLVCHLTWIKNDFWKMSVISFSDRTKRFLHGTDLTRAKESLNGISLNTSNERARIMLREKNKDNTVLVAPEQIEWVESDDHFSILHFADVTLTVSEEIRSLARMTDKYLIHCHESYLVNPLFIGSIARFKITMKSGEVIPVPEKKFTSVKKMIFEFFA